MKQRYILFLFALLCSAYSFGFMLSQDDDPLKNLLLKLEQYRDKNPLEKIHLHTDRPYYAIGDTIWFKAYVVNSERNQLSALSKILYVDLINEKDSLKKSLRLPLNSGLAWGDFVLSDSLSEGNYRLRAYTTWMRNFGEEYYFDRTIQIGDSFSNQLISNVKYTFSKTGIKENVIAGIAFEDINGKPVAGKEVSYSVQLDHRSIASGKGITNPAGELEIKFTNAQPFVLKAGRINTTIRLDDKTFVKKSFPLKATSAETDVQFFPEGGQLVSGIRSRVAFKAIGADGMSREISGIILDRENDTVTDFKSEHAGMGTLSLMPLKGQAYTALVKFKDGSEKRVELPQALARGYVLSVFDIDQDNLLVKIAASPELRATGEVSLVALHNGTVQFTSRNLLSNTVFSSTVPKKRFPSGILHFTLFSPSYQPVAERLVFINNNDQLALQASTDKTSYGKRQKVKLDLSCSDTPGQAPIANFSVSVINETEVPSDETKESTILSNLLLTSDLKGYVEKPNYYFMDQSEEKRRHLDQLLLTQGWRRFSWTNIIAGSYPSTIYPPEQGIILSGRVSTPNGAAVAGGKVTLLAAKGNSVILDTLTDAEGRFRFDRLSFNDSTSFVLQARSAKGRKNVYIEIDRLPAQLVTRNKNAADAEINVNQSMLEYLRIRKGDFDQMRKSGLLRKSIMLQEVKVVQKKPAVTNSSNLNGAGNADAVIKADQLKNCLSLPQCLPGMVAGVVIQNGIAYSTRSMYSSFSGLVPMQLVIDGMYVEPSYLAIIPPQDVETIEVLKSGANTAIYGIRGGGGVLIINTKRGERNLSYRSFAPGIASYTPQGLYYGREFYSPAYPPTETPPQAAADLRKTIYWAPNISTNSEGRSSLSFFTADSPGTYKVTIEGLSASGALGRKVYRFKVE